MVLVGVWGSTPLGHAEADESGAFSRTISIPQGVSIRFVPACRWDGG